MQKHCISCERATSDDNRGLNTELARVGREIEPSPVGRNGPAVGQQREDVWRWRATSALAAVAAAMRQFLLVAAAPRPLACLIDITARRKRERAGPALAAARLTSHLTSDLVHAAQQACARWPWVDTHALSTWKGESQR